MTSFKAVVDGEPVSGYFTSLSDGTIEATINGRAYKFGALASEPGMFWIKLDDRSLEAVVVPAAGGGYAVALGGERFHIEIEDSRSALRRTNRGGRDGAAHIKAPMPGKIVCILVAEGTTVSANQGILTMEAMKMQNEIKSPKAGVVKAIHVQQGATVNAGDLLAIVE